MNKDEIQQALIEAGVPEDRITEMVDIFFSNTVEEGRQARVDNVHDDIRLSLLAQNEPDWRKRAAIAAAIMSRNLGD